MTKQQKYNPFPPGGETHCSNCDVVMTHSDGRKTMDTYITEYGVTCPECYKELLAADKAKLDEQAASDPICPSCKRLIPDMPWAWRRLNPRLVMNSLSRRDNKTYICNHCGQAEALADYFTNPDQGIMTDAEARRSMEVNA